MNVFHQFTRKSLLKNRTRTLVTVIGIVLSMALFTAVIEGAYSGVQFLIRSVVDGNGAFQGYYYDLTEAEAQEAQSAEGIKDSATWQQVGWAEISENEVSPYLLIKSISGNFSDLVAVHLVSGRMPENENEIILPVHLGTTGGVQYTVGDTLTLDVGKRTADGEEVAEEYPYLLYGPEEITDTTERTYTVVGIYERLNYSIEAIECPGYTALTAGGGTGYYSVFFTLKPWLSFYSYMEEHAISPHYAPHLALLTVTGTLRNGNMSALVYGFAAVLVFLISFGSISLIYNSFSISVSERTRQFGILKSVGATKKQIRGSVLYEALLLCGVGIPMGLIVGCVGIGITLWCLRDAFTGMFFTGSAVQMRLVLNPLALLAAVAVCLVTTLISAWIPARRAIRISPIESIRQSGDVKIKGKEVRTSKLTQKLFGFEGMMASKNFKRNRKRYRSTVISLFLSVTLFISAASFCSYLTDAVDGFTSSDMDADIVYSIWRDSNVDPDEVLALLSSVEGVTESGYLSANYNAPYFHLEDVSEEYWDTPFSDRSYYEEQHLDAEVSGKVAFIDDEAFRQLCRENGLNAEDYFDADAPKAVVYNQSVVGYSEDDGPAKYYHFTVLDEERLPITGYVEIVREYGGYINYDEEIDENGNLWYLYYPEEDWSRLLLSSDDYDEVTPEESKIMRIPAGEAVLRADLTISAVVQNLPLSLSTKNMAILYPYSMKQAVLGEELEEQYIYSTEFAFTAPNHSQVYNEMKQRLTDNGMETGSLTDAAAQQETERALVFAVNVFAYGFIILISLIAVANVFNTISTNVSLRRREFAMLRSIGLSGKGFRKMMNYECIIYGLKGLAWGLPVSVAMTYLIYRITGLAYRSGFYIPWYSMAIAVGSVFAVVFATMLYATNKIKHDDPIDALKNENL